jgi:hypothetical protein
MNTFSQADHEAIRRFTYQGGDSSLLYKYVLSPIAQYLVDKVSPFLILRILVYLIYLSFITMMPSIP